MSLRWALQRFLSGGHLRCRLCVLSREYFLEQGFQSLGATPRARYIAVGGLRDLCHLDKRELNEQTFVGTGPIVDIALVHDLERLIEERRGAFLSLCLETLALRLADLQEGDGLRVFRHHHIAHVAGQSVNQMTAIEALGQNLVKQNHDVGSLVLDSEVDDSEIVLSIKHIEVFNDFLIRDVALGERCHLVEDGQRVAHTAVGLFGYHGQCLVFIGVAFFLGHHLQMVDGALNGHPLEVIDLAARDDSRQNLVLLGGSQYEDDMCGRLFQSLQECVEGLR